MVHTCHLLTSMYYHEPSILVRDRRYANKLKYLHLMFRNIDYIIQISQLLSYLFKKIYCQEYIAITLLFLWTHTSNNIITIR